MSDKKKILVIQSIHKAGIDLVILSLREGAADQIVSSLEEIRD